MTVVLNKSSHSLGASGCIFGLLGSIGAYYYTNRKTFKSSSEAALDSIKRTLLFNVLYGGMSPGIDHWAHAGGFVFGSLLAYGIGPRYFFSKAPANRLVIIIYNVYYTLFRYELLRFGTRMVLRKNEYGLLGPALKTFSNSINYVKQKLRIEGKDTKNKSSREVYDDLTED